MNAARNPVRREEILDYATYADLREKVREQAMQAKAQRRVTVADVFTFHFENRETVRYQVQEMVRVERMVREADIQHELDTYNELLGGAGELGCTLMIEIADRAERARLLPRWVDLPDHLYARLEDGARVPARYDERQRSTEKLSAVQFLKFDTRGQVPVALGIDFPAAELVAETELSPEQRAALAADLEV